MALQTGERRREILRRLRYAGSIRVAELSRQFDVASETIRRDLQLLEELGYVRRIHGGACLADGADLAARRARRGESPLTAGVRVARAAAGLLGDAETVFIDEGRTARLIAEVLPRDRSLRVVTASLGVARSLAALGGVEVTLLGGRVRGETAVTTDHWATTMLRDRVLDLAYVEAHGVSRVHGLTTVDPAVGEVKAQAVRRARRTVVICAHTALGAVDVCHFAGLDDIGAVVTDGGLTMAEADRFGLLGLQLVHG